MVVFDDGEQKIKEFDCAEEVEGSLRMNLEEDKLMHSVLPSDKKEVEQGLIVEEGQNFGVGVFSPDLLFEHMVRNYHVAEQLFGPKLLRLITGYTGSYLERNLRVPEFQKKVLAEIEERVEGLRRAGVIDEEGVVTVEGLEGAGLVVALEELDTLSGVGLRSRSRKVDVQGEVDVSCSVRIGRFRDMHVRKTVSRMIKRGVGEFRKEDVVGVQRRGKGGLSVVYALDASASMRGEKLKACRRAGICLAYSAIKKKDRVGLVVFGEQVKDAVVPTHDFLFLVRRMMGMTASTRTDFVVMVEKVCELLAREKGQRHVIIISDALPTAGVDPLEGAKKVVAAARASGVTFSFVGVQLNEEGVVLAKELVELGGGRLYVVKNVDEVKGVVLEEYEKVRV